MKFSEKCKVHARQLTPTHHMYLQVHKGQDSLDTQGGPHIRSDQSSEPQQLLVLHSNQTELKFIAQIMKHDTRLCAKRRHPNWSKARAPAVNHR